MTIHVAEIFACIALPSMSIVGLQYCSDKETSLNDDDKSNKELVKMMTLEEKAKLVVGTGLDMSSIVYDLINGDQSRSSADVFFNELSKVKHSDASNPSPLVTDKVKKLVPGAAGTTHKISRLGIKSVVLADGPAGLRISPTRKNDDALYFCTAFPIGTLLASTWNVDAVNRVGEAMGSEVLEYGADVILGPAVNIHRNPLCGRNYEYYSEDPYITGKIAAAMINGIQSNGVGTSLKHYAANNAETNRNNLNSIVSERALREIYLKGFEIAVKESQPWTVMSSYNLINGTYSPQSYDLLTRVLREDFGFKGVVMTDWLGGEDPVEMMKAGNDILMPGKSSQVKKIMKAVKKGILDESILDKNVERILDFILLTPKGKNYNYSNIPDLRTNSIVARDAAAEGMVLLKNDNEALPLSSSINSVAVFGVTSYDLIIGGTGSGDVNEPYRVSLINGLENSGYIVEDELDNYYSEYLAPYRKKKPKAGVLKQYENIPELDITKEMAEDAANNANVALITIGRSSGEGGDREAIDGDFLLTASELDMIKTVSEAFQAKGKRAVVILNIGGVVETASWKDIPDAILLAWQAGQETGNSIVDILSGKVNPSGKLPMTFPVAYSDVPSSKNFPETLPEGQEPEKKKKNIASSFMSKHRSEVVYEEGIYVGYRYYNTFKVPVSYEFGHGLSYTTFSIDNLIAGRGESDSLIELTCDVTNTGLVAGKEVVQLYITAPDGKMEKPESELRGFAKSTLLQPGEKQVVSFVIQAGDLASFDTASSSWIAEKGEYSVKIGHSSLSISQVYTFTLDEDIVVSKVNKALVPNVTIREMSKQ